MKEQHESADEVDTVTHQAKVERAWSNSGRITPQTPLSYGFSVAKLTRTLVSLCFEKSFRGFMQCGFRGFGG